MRQAILHIGTMKTGSTSIQKVLREHRDALPDQGACYPLSPGRGAHVLLTFAVREWPAARARRRSSGAKAERFNGRLDRFRTGFAAEMAALPASVTRVILSDERMSLLKSAQELADLKEILQPYFDEFIVVVYLRSQDSLLASRYSEYLRMGTLSGPDHEVATPARLWHYDYNSLLSRWAAVFGSENMRPRLYERGTKSNFDSINDFLDVCGVKLDVPADDPARHRNLSMSFAGQTLMLRMAKLAREKLGNDAVNKTFWHEISLAVSRAVPGQGWLPTRAEAAAFMQRFEASNEALRQTYFPDRPYLFADGSARFPQAPMTTNDEAVLQAACLAFLESAQRVASRAELKKMAAAGGRRKRRGAAEEIDDDDEEEEEDGSNE